VCLPLLSFGVSTFFKNPSSRFAEKLAITETGASTVARSIASTFVLTITNPATLIGFTALFAGLGGLMGDSPSFIVASFVVLGVFAGSAIWWLTLTTLVGFVHARIDDRVVRLINEVSGLAVAAFGIAVLVHLVVVQIL
jgi:threonine/homoserine/homoserine lactone efflux protein